MNFQSKNEKKDPVSPMWELACNVVKRLHKDVEIE